METQQIIKETTQGFFGRLGVLTSTERLLEMRNRLVSEYMIDSAKFAQDLVLSKEYNLTLIETFNHLRQDAMIRIGHKNENLPEQLILPEQV